MESLPIDTCAFTYNTSQHESTKYTPFMLMFGRRATLPIDVEFERQCPEDLCKTYWELEEHPYHAAFSEHAHILEEAKGNIIAAQLVQCGLCEQWFHIKCVSLHSLPSSAEEWNCSLCT